MNALLHLGDLDFNWRWLVPLQVLWVIAVSMLILLQRRSAASTLAWLLVLTFLPIAGLMLYRLIGPLRLERKQLKRQVSRRVVDEALGTLAKIAEGSPEHRQLAMVPIRLGEAAPLRAEHVDLYDEGIDAYAAITAAVAAAKHHVHLEYYIWEPGRSGTRLRDLLVEKARAGVEVRLILDAAGSSRLSRKFLRPLRAAGVKVVWFNPLSLRRLQRRRADFRTHRKIVVCDGLVGFTGGMNIADEQTAEFSPEAWRDSHVRIEGSAVRALQRIFIEDWFYTSRELLQLSPAYFPEPREAGDQIVQLVASGPDSASFAVHKLFFTAINQANRRLWITTPYLVPDESVASALLTAALRGVDVRIIVPKKGDNFLVDLAARSYFPELLEVGIKIFEYETRFIHSKTMVVDDDVAIVATANLDNRSFRLNFELAAVVYGGTLNERMSRVFLEDLCMCRVSRTQDVTSASLPRRLGQAVARLFSPLL